MLKNYLNIALRNLRRHAGFFAINVSGLTAGIAVCLLIVLFVHDELSYDRFHSKADRIFRLTRHSTSEGQIRGYANTSAAAGPALEAEYPEVERAVRFMLPMPREIQVTHEENRFTETGLYWVDDGVFSIFDFRLERGNPESALAEPFTIVITETIAEKYFGGEDPIGKRLTIEGWQTNDYVVTGILNEFPAQSHLQFDMLASLSGEEPLYPFLFSGEGQWSNSLFYTYVLLHEKSQAERIGTELKAFADRHMGEYARSRGFEPDFALQPVTTIHLHSRLATEREATGGILYIYVFIAVAAFILLIACINFMNLTTARSSQRVKEIGMRKVLGAFRGQLIGQFLGESVLMALLSFTAAAVLVFAVLPSFNQFVGKQLALDAFGGGLLAVIGMVLIGLVGLLAGGYPAFFLSRFQPISALKNQLGTGTGAGLRKTLVVIQFTTSIVLIFSTIVIYSQMEFLRHRPLGFDADQIILLPLSEGMLDRVETLQTAIEASPNVEQSAVSSGVPGYLRLIDRFPVAPFGAAETSQQPMYVVGADYDFLDLLGVAWVAGRNFDPAYPTDASSAFILTELAVQRLGLENPLEARITLKEGDGKTGTVIGVVKDFHLQSLHHPLEPVAIHMWPERFTTLSVKVHSDAMAETLEFLESTWREHVPETLFSYRILDENFAGQYASEQRFGVIMRWFAGLAILIACLGLLGLVSFVAERRVKEIGVRKVLGASISNIVSLMSIDFMKLVLVAFFLSVPISFFAMDWWLAGFAFSMKLHAGLFILAGAIAGCIAFAITAFQSVRAGLSNPIEALKCE